MKKKLKEPLPIGTKVVIKGKRKNHTSYVGVGKTAIVKRVEECYVNDFGLCICSGDIDSIELVYRFIPQDRLEIVYPNHTEVYLYTGWDSYLLEVEGVNYGVVMSRKQIKPLDDYGINLTEISLRDEPFYKSLDSYKACAYAEGFCEGEGASETEQLCAWQYLVDKDLCWSLQGWYGRTAEALINEGVIERKIK